MYETEFKRIIEASENNALTFFVGAGISALSGAPNWKGLIDKLCEQMGHSPKEQYSSDENLQIPQMYYYSIGKNDAEYYAFIKDNLISSSLTTNDIHRKMLNLNPVSFITTNYDDLLEEAAIQHCQSFKVIASDADVPLIHGDRFILKMHGDFHHKNIVLKEEDYLNYSENFKLIETLVKSIFSMNTVVFIGYSLNDYNIKLILNWAKALLKSNFRKPIFIYAGNKILTPEEVYYQESRGLSLLNCNNLTLSDDYLPRYQSIFAELDKLNKLSIDGKTEEEAFDVLYGLLSPLDKLEALRISDVSEKVSPYIIIDDAGTIQPINKKENIIQKFMKINRLPDSEKSALPKIIQDKYLKILSVFRKARIHFVFENNKVRKFIDQEDVFGDKDCIQLNYSSILKYVGKNYNDIRKKYKKAYYFTRLEQFDKAIFLFAEVAKQAFKAKDYLLYYFAEANLISLEKVIKNRNKYYNCYDMNDIEAISPTDYEIEHLFDLLPSDFRDTFASLKTLHSPNMLFKYSYEASIDRQKLERAIDSRSIEFGLTSSNKAICRINDYLHFFLRNGIVSDVFIEYKNTVKTLMSELIRKYSTQNKTIIHQQVFPVINSSPVYFDEVDFYCFIECFNDKDIESTFSKYNIQTIEFHNMEKIESSVNNLIIYFLYVIKNPINNVDITGLEAKIKACLMLLRYVDISQHLVDMLCSFLLNNVFSSILINDIILFLDSQVFHRKKSSNTTSIIIEKKLFMYLDQNITALINQKEYDVPSSHSAISYCNLVNYIYPETPNFISRKLSLRISKIIKHNLIALNRGIAYNFCPYLSDYQKKKIANWAKSTLVREFRYDMFFLLVQCDVGIDSEIIEVLKNHLHLQIEKVKMEPINPGIKMFPKLDPYETLNYVGFLCLINVLNKSDFSEFIGINQKFDFFYLYNEYDFSKFDIAWLFGLYSYALEKISENNEVKKNIREKIVNTLKEKNIFEEDAIYLKNMLIKYFC